MSLIERAQDELGYLEKSKAAFDKYGEACLWPKTQYAGCDNLTKYAVIAHHPNGQPWCQTFQNALLIEEYGRDVADKLLCGKVNSASTMDVKDAMIKAGRGVPLNEAKPKDLVFRSRSGGGHVGLVIGWHNGGLVTIEGNSSAADITSWNGGAVVEHYGATWMWCCRPDYSIVSWHWVKVDGIYYYQDAQDRNSYGWKIIPETSNPDNKHWYYFNSIGQMQTGIQHINGAVYYLAESGGLEGALCITDESGALSPWFV